ncbi:MAG: sigma-70 family RNA polymerase sigma factor, partial [Burkholderiaceae bacterium]|nr:sigma-70 family RNA polymerase sigma factor [Burkholderiaceae bacterium]
LLATAARDVDAFARLYQRCAPLLLGVAQRITRRRELAEEVVHDGFARIWRAADTFDPFGAPVGWMTAIVRNRAIDVMETHDMARVDSYHAALDDQPEASLDQMFDWTEDVNAEDTLDASRLRAFLRRCLGELAAAERQALVLAYEHGLSHGDLASHLGKPLGTVKTWVRRGMLNLRTCIDQCTGDAGAGS